MSDFKATREQSQAADPQNTVWVTANAGSGKTHVLVERVARLLLSGADPSAILCITYTKAAAAEMSGRLFARLSKWTIMSDAALTIELTELNGHMPSIETQHIARRLFARALETPGGLKIQTIHAFCEKLLQQFPVEAGMAPGFSVMTERDNAAQITEAISEILTRAASKDHPLLTKALAKVINHISSNTFDSLIRQFLSDSKGLRNLVTSELDDAGYALVLKSSLELPLEMTVESVAAEICNIDQNEYAYHANILKDIKVHRSHDTAGYLHCIANSVPSLENLKSLFLTAELTARASLMSVDTAKRQSSTAEFLEKEKQRFIQLLYQYDLLMRVDATANLFTMAKAIHNRIEQRKKFLGQYDFDDLINRTSKLLNSARAAQWVLYKLDAGLKHILVDEAQDTSPAQWKIISAIVEEFFTGQAGLQKNDRTLFVVGDRKQSIYSFQGADIHALGKARTALSERILGTGKTLSNVDLAISYRTTPQVLAIVDKVFPPNQPGRLGFDLTDQSENPHQSNRLNEKGKFELWPLLESLEEDTEEKPWDAPVDREPSHSPRRILARKIAETVKFWIGKRQLTSRGRAVQAGDILILFQSRSPLFSMLISELRKHEIPVAGADRLRLRESLIVQDLLILLQWLLIPQDDHALACVLKGPLLVRPVSEDELMHLAIGRGTSSLWSRLQQKPDENHTRLCELQQQILRIGPYEFFASVLTKARLNIVKRLGTEAIDASNAFLDQAMTYQHEQGTSLTGFLHWFQSSDTNIKREMEQATGEVRLMTVHGAKGLEADIVFLADATSEPAGGRSEPMLLAEPTEINGAGLPLWVLGNLTEAPILQHWKTHAKQKAQAERNRLLYVAMTRARDELYVCGIKTPRKIPVDSWYATIEAAVGDEFNTIADPESSTVATQLVELSPSPKIEIPLWAITTASPEKNTSIYSLTGLVEKHRSTEIVRNPNAQRRGVVIHGFLHELTTVESDRQENYAKNWAKRLNFPEVEALNLLSMIKSPELAPFFGPDSQSEAELRGTLLDGREVSGRVDRLCIEKDQVLILDYKTDRVVPKSIGVSHPYVSQMALYAELLELAYPNRKIMAALFWTQDAKIMWLEQGLLTTSREFAVESLELEAS